MKRIVVAVLVSLIVPILGAPAQTPPAPARGAAEPKPRLVILGDSLAAGFGVDPSEAFPARLEAWMRESGFSFDVVNAGVSGDTTAGGLRRLGWILRRPVDVLLVELGGNDGLRGLPPEATRSNLVAIVRLAREKSPEVRIVLTGMQMPPNMGVDYQKAFQEVFPSVAGECRVALVPHLLEGVGGRPEWNLPDQIHPTAAGHAVVATNVWNVLKPILEVHRGAR